MKTLKVFLASSDELAEERQKFGNLIRRLDDIYLRRGIHVQLLAWEDMDPCYNNVRKQDEYNAWIRQCDIFVCLFYTRAGQYTLEELEVARQEYTRRQEPKLMIYCRDLRPGEVEMADLLEFKYRLEHELGHFWGHYPTTDKLHLDFVMFLMRLEEGRSSALKVENDGRVVVDGLTVACMDNLPFAAENEGYNMMKAELEALPAQIGRARSRTEKYPDDQDFRDDLQALLRRYNDLREKFSSHQQALVATAQRIAEMQLETVSSEMKRAISEFEAGRVEAANAILDGIEREAERHFEQLERDRKLVHQDIEALHLKTKTLLADVSIPLSQRVGQVLATFRKADEWAQKSAMEGGKYGFLLDDYARFLFTYGMYDQALEVCRRLCGLSEEYYGLERQNTATVYNNLAVVCEKVSDYQRALEYHQKALRIREKVLGAEHPDTAQSYNNIGAVYNDLGDYARALDFYQKALAIKEKELGTAHPETATSYNSIGIVSFNLGDYARSLEYYQKALSVREQTLGLEHPETAMSHSNIGSVYYALGNYDQALACFQKSLAIRERTQGAEHPDTAISLNNIGACYHQLGDYSRALEFHLRALAITERVLGTDHPDTATSYNNVGGTYDALGDPKRGLQYYQKALDIRERVLGNGHPSTAESYNNVGFSYCKLGNFTLALACYQKALDIRERVLGTEHPDTADSYNNIGFVYSILGDDVRALEYYQKALAVYEKVLGPEHPNTKTVRENMDAVKKKND